jgi:hypothetical protein
MKELLRDSNFNTYRKNSRVLVAKIICLKNTVFQGILSRESNNLCTSVPISYSGSYVILYELPYNQGEMYTPTQNTYTSPSVSF